MKKAVIALYVIVAGQFVLTSLAFFIAYSAVKESMHDVAYELTKRAREYGDSHYVLREPQQ